MGEPNHPREAGRQLHWRRRRRHPRGRLGQPPALGPIHTNQWPSIRGDSPPPPRKKKRAGGGERARREGGLRSALREMFLQPPGAKGWQVSGLGERRAGGRAGAPCARSGGGGWWSKVAGTAKGGVTGGSGREGGVRARARVCPAGAGARAPPRRERGSCEPAPGGVGTTGPHARRQRPASRRGAEAGAERVVRKQG